MPDKVKVSQGGVISAKVYFSMDDQQPEWASVRMTPRARLHYEKRFLPKYRHYLKQVSEMPLTLLVWGPGETGGDLYNKRLQIRAQLRDRGFAAVFSEEVELDCPVPDVSLKAKELLQALSADLTVVLQASFGSTAEVHDFATFVRDIGRKMVVFISRDLERGYSYQGALHDLNVECGNVHLFDYPKDVEECHLSTKVIERADALRHAKWQRKHIR